MIKISSSGNFDNLENFLKKASNNDFYKNLEMYGQLGVDALKSSTPINSGKTADSWSYKITMDDESIKIEWLNSNLSEGIPVAILIQYGHATRNGGYVEGQDFINSATKPIFDEIANKVWEEVCK